jgi:hypothetical protein
LLVSGSQAVARPAKAPSATTFERTPIAEKCE